MTNGTPILPMTSGAIVDGSGRFTVEGRSLLRKIVTKLQGQIDGLTVSDQHIADILSSLTGTDGNLLDLSAINAQELAAIAAVQTPGLMVRDALGNWFGRAATGTSNRVTVTFGDGTLGNPTFDIAATYAGQTSITTLGTIATGTWNATAIAAPKGGTGQTTYAVGDMLYASSTTALSKLAASTNGYVLTLVSGVPAWAAASSGGGGDVAGDTHAATSKTTPVDADELPLVDSAASNVLKKLTWANLKATLKTYFDTLYTTATAVAAAYQPLDADLTSIAGLTFSQGDILYRNASGLTRLGAGTSGQLLKTMGAGANPTWASVAGVSGGMDFVATATVAGSAATSLTLSGLDLGADHTYFVEFAIKNALPSTAISIPLTYNGDTTAGNYWNQSISGNGTVNGARSNTAVVLAVTGGTTSTVGTIQIRNDVDGKPRALIFSNREGATGIQVQLFAHAWVTASNVTSITLTSSVANGFDVGSNIKLWRLT